MTFAACCIGHTVKSSATATGPRGIKTEILAPESTIVRVHHQQNGAISFGPKPGLPLAYRSDAPDGEYRTMYPAAAIDGAFVETILHRRTKDQTVSEAFVDQRAWTEECAKGNETGERISVGRLSTTPV
jgi:hypothetical protein